MWKKYAGYFARPFPKAAGFSPYRSPGVIVHLPFWGLLIGDGLYWCLPDTHLLPLLPVYIIGGLYLGRDLAISAHYNLFITLGVVGCMFFLLIWGPGRMIGFEEFRIFYGAAFTPFSILNAVLVLFLCWRNLLAVVPAYDHGHE